MFQYSLQHIAGATLPPAFIWGGLVSFLVLKVRSVKKIARPLLYSIGSAWFIWGFVYGLYSSDLDVQSKILLSGTIPMGVSIIVSVLYPKKRAEQNIVNGDIGDSETLADKDGSGGRH